MACAGRRIGVWLHHSGVASHVASQPTSGPAFLQPFSRRPAPQQPRSSFVALVGAVGQLRGLLASGPLQRRRMLRATLRCSPTTAGALVRSSTSGLLRPPIMWLTSAVTVPVRSASSRDAEPTASCAPPTKRRRLQPAAATPPQPSASTSDPVGVAFASRPPAAKAKAAPKPTKEEEAGPWMIVGLGNPGANYDDTRHK